MRGVAQIYNDIIKKLEVFGMNDSDDKELQLRAYKKYTDRLTAFIIGMVIGSELGGDKIDKLAKQIQKLNKKA